MSDATHTCLFTGVDLDENTTPEHTILRALGGRIESRIVSSTAFNNECSSSVDAALAGAFRGPMNWLGPLLPGEFKTTLAVEGEDGEAYMFGKNGVLVLAKPIVGERKADGRPKSVTVNEGEVPRGLRIVQTDTPRSIERTLIKEQVLYEGTSLLDPAAELCALKCGLLTLDDRLAHQNSIPRFTRDQSLKPTLEYVRQAVFANGMPPAAFTPAHRVCYGLQFDHIDDYQRMAGLAAKSAQHSSTEFQHAVLAVGNAATGTIDLVVNLFSAFPFGFRISQTRRGLDFAVAVLNSPEAYGSASGLLAAVRPTGMSTLITPTRRTSFPGAKVTDFELDALGGQISDQRVDLHRRIQLAVITKADRFVTDALKRAVENGVTVYDAIQGTLRVLYQRRLEDDDAPLRNAMRHVAWVRSVTVDSADRAIDDPSFWSAALTGFRRAVGVLVDVLGNPGEMNPEVTSRRVPPAPA